MERSKSDSVMVGISDGLGWVILYLVFLWFSRKILAVSRDILCFFFCSYLGWVE